MKTQLLLTALRHWKHCYYDGSHEKITAQHIRLYIYVITSLCDLIIMLNPGDIMKKTAKLESMPDCGSLLYPPHWELPSKLKNHTMQFFDHVTCYLICIIILVNLVLKQYANKQHYPQTRFIPPLTSVLKMITPLPSGLCIRLRALWNSGNSRNKKVLPEGVRMTLAGRCLGLPKRTAICT